MDKWLYSTKQCWSVTREKLIASQDKDPASKAERLKPKNVDGWKQITSAVQNAGGIIFSQLCHVGRISHTELHLDGQPVAYPLLEPSPLGQDYPLPHKLSIAEIDRVIEGYKLAAKQAIQVGFDGVEIHAGFGYLIDQFLHSQSNRRLDGYGGSPINRARLAMYVVKAVSDEIGPQRTALRLTPFAKEQYLDDPDVIETVLLLTRRLEEQGILYLHIAEADWNRVPIMTDEFLIQLRENFSREIVITGNYTQQMATSMIERHLADFVGFG